MDNSKNTREDFADTASDPSTWVFPKTVPELQDTIYKIYKIDVLAIKNLVFLAQKLQTDGITIPSKSYFKDQIQVSAEDPLNNLRVGSAWGIPGIYSDGNRDIVVGSEQNIYIGSGKSRGLNINPSGNATFSGTIKCDDITGTTITNIKNDITTKETTLKTLISELTTRVSALEGKTKKLSCDGNTSTFSGPMYSAGIKDTINGTQFGLGYGNQNQIFGVYTWLKGQFVYRDGILHPCNGQSGC